MKAPHKGQAGVYKPDCGWHTFSAVVDRVHHDGSITVEVLRLLDGDGKETGERFNKRFRVDASAFTAKATAP